MRFLLVFWLLLSATPVFSDDSWDRLQAFYGSGRGSAPRVPVSDVVVEDEANGDMHLLSGRTSQSPKKEQVPDPWLLMQSYYVPFSEAEEVEVFSNPQSRRKVAGYLNEKLHPYRALIEQAAGLFDIPPEVIGAVIMVESSGNRWAKAKTSSAKGLMQTIRATFAEARAGLRSRGIDIANDPYQPRASILAGSWYLDRMFRQMEKDQRRRFGRDDLEAWRKVAEYYYAGPNHGRKRAGVVIMYAGGRRVVVDKAGYAQKVMRWARALG